MPNLERAIETTEAIRDALASQVAIARAERALIRDMDVDGLNVRATNRADFNQKAALLQQALTGQLAAIADGFGLKEASLDAVARRAPDFAQRMTTLLSEIRALASALKDLDNLNRTLAQRALMYVRAHLAVLCPRPAAYDRRGASGSEGRASTTVVRVL